MAKGKAKRKVGAGDVASNRYASHRYQLLERLAARAAERGLTLVPTRIYFSGPHAKVEIALARGKDLYDKRQSLRERDVRRDIERGLREARR